MVMLDPVSVKLSLSLSLSLSHTHTHTHTHTESDKESVWLQYELESLKQKDKTSNFIIIKTNPPFHIVDLKPNSNTFARI